VIVAKPRPSARVRFGRREALRAALAASIGIPWLETFSPRSARADEAVNKRFVVMFSPNGTLYDKWLPNGQEENFTLSPILQPLAAHQRDLVVVAGLTQKGAGGDGHQNGMGGMLTGAPLRPGRFAGTGAPPAGWADGPSVDQRIAQALGKDSTFRSLEFAVHPETADNWGRMIYRAANQPLAPRSTPRQVFDDLFGTASLPPAERERVRARRQSVLDHVTGRFTELSQSVSGADRQRLEAHLSYLREVEARLQAQAQDIGACTIPPVPADVKTVNASYPSTGAALMDLMVLALACRLTPVASLQWSRSVSQIVFSWLGIGESHHGLSHFPDNDAAAQDKLLRINTWYAERFAELIAKLKAYSEGERTLFDNCLLLWCNELGRGNTHSRERAPYVLAGSAGGALRTGRFLKFDALPHNNLLVSILNCMGLPDQSFGKADWCSGALAGFA